MTSDKVDTKLEALKLITDPSRLFSLLFSKYGDIQEDFYIEISNQLIFNKLSHFNIYFKELNTFFDKTENIRRFYPKHESDIKIPKLNEYYKNYQTFFCKATLSDIGINNLLKNYQDTKAEIFYYNNYGNSSSNKEENEQSKIIHNSSSLSSLDNITYNRTIFDKKYKNIIENCNKSNSLILTLDSYLNSKNADSGFGKGNLISFYSSDSNNEKDKSFVEGLNNLISCYNKKKEKMQKNLKENNEDKNNDINNTSKQMNTKIKNQILNKKETLDKSNRENNKNQSIIFKPKVPNLLIAKAKKNNNNNNIKESNDEKRSENLNNIEIKDISSKNTKNLMLSPNKKKFNFTNLTSRFSEFKKLNPINIKRIKRNKSYHLNNNKNNNQFFLNNKLPNSNNNIAFPSNNQIIEFNIKNINNNSTKNNSNKNTLIAKSNNSQISRYNQFLKGNNKLRKNPKNITYELKSKGNKIKNIPNQNIIFYQYKKMIHSPNQRNKIENNHNYKSNFNLFKSGNLSPTLNPINKHDNKRSINILQRYNKLFNQTKNLEQHKKLIISSNSLENNIHISSLSPKSISSDLKVNKGRRNIQDNINIINKGKLPRGHNKNRMKGKTNNNYNINFTNLFFYGPNTPTNYFDNIKNNIINNQNVNINKINTNFYMLNFDNLNSSNQYNSRNKIQVNNINNNSLYKIKYKTNNNGTRIPNLRKSESQKGYTTYNKRGHNLNEKKIPFPINKILKL